MDDIGLGGALAILVYLFILLITIVGVVVLFVIKKGKWAFWWVSVMFNVFFFLYFPGGNSDLRFSERIFVMIAWPVANLAWLLDLVRSEWRGRKNKNKKFFKNL